MREGALLSVKPEQSAAVRKLSGRLRDHHRETLRAP
jgi:hypothetical protein